MAAQSSVGVRRLVNAEGLAEYLDLKGGARSVYKLVEQTDMPFVRIGRRVRFDVDAVIDYFRERGGM